MTVGEGVLGALGVIVVVVIAREIQLARRSMRDRRCITCGEPAEDIECDACWSDRQRGGP